VLEITVDERYILYPELYIERRIQKGESKGNRLQ
jgi:hypothetical protein